MDERPFLAPSGQADVFTAPEKIQRQTLNDIINLVRILDVISGEHNSVHRALGFMRILKILFESILGDKIANQTMLLRRYRNLFNDDPDEELVAITLRRLERAGWLYYDPSGFVVTPVGIRYYGELMIMMNKTVSYYSKDTLEQKLYMAELIGLHIKLLQQTDIDASSEIATLCVMIDAARSHLQQNLHLYLQDRTAIRHIASIHDLLFRVIELLKEVIDHTVQSDVLGRHLHLLDLVNRVVSEAQWVCNETLTEGLRISRLLNDEVRHHALDEKEFYDSLLREIREEFAREDASSSPLATLLQTVEADETDRGSLETFVWLATKIPGIIADSEWDAVLTQYRDLFRDSGRVPFASAGTLELSQVKVRRVSARELEDIERMSSHQRETSEIEAEIAAMVSHLELHAERWVSLYECVLGSPFPNRHGASILLDLLSEFGRKEWLHVRRAESPLGQDLQFGWHFQGDTVADDTRFRTYSGYDQFLVPNRRRLQQIRALLADTGKSPDRLTNQEVTR